MGTGIQAVNWQHATEPGFAMTLKALRAFDAVDWCYLELGMTL